MWIAIVGGIGTCKQTIADVLVKGERFKQRCRNKVEPTSDPFEEQFRHMISYAEFQLELQKEMHDEDVVTIRTFWDSHEVFSRLTLDSGLINKLEYERLASMYAVINHALVPPHAFVYLHNDTISSHNRVSLTKKDVAYSDEYINRMRELYVPFVEKIKVPVLEIDASKSHNQIVDDVQYGLHSLKAADLTATSIWDRRLF